MMTGFAFLQDRVGYWSRRAQVIVFLVCMIGFIVFGYALLIKQEANDYFALLKKEQDLRQIVALYHQQSNKLHHKSPLDRIFNRFPTANHKPVMVDSLVALAQEEGLSFDLMQPLPDKSHESYMESPILLVARGPYSHCLAFLSRLTDLNDWMAWSDISLTNATKDSLKMKMTIHIYWRLIKGQWSLKPMLSRAIHSSLSGFNPFKPIMRTLNETPVEAMQFMGVLRGGTNTLGLIKDLGGRIHVVKTGDYIGRGKARVVAIENDQVGIEEWIRVGHGMVKKLMTLHL